MKKFLSALILLGAASAVHAAPVTYQFTGTSSSTMSVNNGTSTGSIPAGTAYSGTLTFDDAQVATPVAFYGGTRTQFQFTSLQVTVGSSTVSQGPGIIDLYNDVNPPNGIPVGDSFYVNFSSPVAPSGPLSGAQFNWIQFALVDTTGTAFTGSALPANLNFTSFRNPFIEFNYGTKGTPWGAGNTSTLQFLASLSKVGGTPTPPPTINTSVLPSGVIGVYYSAPIAVSAPNGDTVTTSVAGLPAGLGFDGANITGTPITIGTSSVTITVTDAVTKLTASSTLPSVSHRPACPTV